MYHLLCPSTSLLCHPHILPHWIGGGGGLNLSVCRRYSVRFSFPSAVNNESILLHDIESNVWHLLGLFRLSRATAAAAASSPPHSVTVINSDLFSLGPYYHQIDRCGDRAWYVYSWFCLPAAGLGKWMCRNKNVSTQSNPSIHLYCGLIHSLLAVSVFGCGFCDK